MDAARYLQRIGYASSIASTPETLRNLQRAHLHTVPFENLDIVPLHRPIRLAQRALWEKIVEHRRGGFCYELNGMFAWLLQQLGFSVMYLNARVFSRAGNLGIDFDHLALLVEVPGVAAAWLADVGFGDSFMDPLMFVDGEQAQGLRAYRLERDSGGYIVWQRDYDQAWQRLYFFDLSPHVFPSEYEGGCTYHQKSPDSSFTRASIISRATETGRISLEQDALIVTENGLRRKLAVAPGEWAQLLLQHFGIVL